MHEQIIQRAQVILTVVFLGRPTTMYTITEPAPEQSTQGGHAFIRGGQSLKSSTIAAVFKKVSLLIGVARPPLGAGSVQLCGVDGKLVWRGQFLIFFLGTGLLCLLPPNYGFYFFILFN